MPLSLSPSLSPVNGAIDARLNLLTVWLNQTGLVDCASLRLASSDASFRRYFRLNVHEAHRARLGATLIAMDAPPERENVRAFIKLAGLFAATGVTVPAIVAQDIAQGLLLVSDLGHTTYLDRLTADNADAMYFDARSALIKFQLHSQSGVLPEYDRAFLLRELRLFPEWYVTRHLGVQMSEQQTSELAAVFDLILANNMAQQQVFVHRDYHSRNLMFLEQGNPGVLDFQDALFGPVSYDLASLLCDAYIAWPEEMVLDQVVRYWQNAKQVGLPVNPDIDAFYRDVEWMALQRHLKILGIFCRIRYRDAKDTHMQYLPQVLDYVRKTAKRYRELRPLLRLLDGFENTPPAVGYTF